MVTIKTEKEIEFLKEGGKRLARILSELEKLVAPGVSTQIFEDKVKELLKTSGDRASFFGYTPAGARRPYPAHVCVSINDEIVHGIPNEHPRKLKEGDIVTLDMGLIHGGMFVDGAITVPVGNIASEIKALLKVNKEALEAGIRQAKGGNTVGDVGAAIEAVAKEHGYSLAEDLCGHGVGYSVHEDPYVPNWGRKGEGEKLVAGMVIAIEPMLVMDSSGKKIAKIKLDADGYTYRTRDGSLSAHFEHTVVITESEPIVVTQ